MLAPNAMTLWKQRYQDDGETLDGFWDRTSGGRRDFRDMLSSLMFLPNSPTLFNMGTKTGGTLSACFVFDIADSLLGDWPAGGLDSPFPDSILGTLFKAACVAKAGGGVGYYLGNVRPAGTLVRSTHKKACGIVPVIRMLNQLRTLITQGGKRDLAQMGVTPIEHADARAVIHCKDEDPQGLSSFNLSMSWRDTWMKRVDFSGASHGTESKLWWEQCESAWKTGCPGMLWWDTINRWNPMPHFGDINATNPCGETPNISNVPCNLGSIALLRFVKDGKVQWDKLKHYAGLATEYLDYVLDVNTFPHPDITFAARHTRQLGLGVMGWADMLALLRIPYDCQEAVDLGYEVMKTINDAAMVVSAHMAVTKGPYPAWDKDKSPVWAPFSRNSTNTSVAPTGSISILANCEPSIEPHYELERTRTTYEGIKLHEKITDWLPDLKDFVPKTAHQVAPEWHVKHLAAFQKHTHLGVSKTVNLPNSATVKDVSDTYKLMYDLGCKGGTIFRDGCRAEQVLVGKKTSVYTTEAATPARMKLENDVPQLPRHKFRVGGTKCYLHIGVVDNKPVEVFLRSSQLGSTIQGMLDAWAMEVSSNLQRGTTIAELVRLHGGSRFEPAGLTGNPELPVCSSIPDYVVRYLEMKFDPTGLRAPTGSGQLCPECGSELAFRGGCLDCLKCTFSRCG